MHIYTKCCLLFVQRRILQSCREAESTRKLAEDLRQKSEKIEVEAATAASMQQQAAPHHSNGYDSYGGFMGGAQNQGGYSNPFAMG